QGRPEREQGGNRGADHAHPNRTCGGEPDPAVATPEPGDRHEAAALAHFCATSRRPETGDGTLLRRERQRVLDGDLDPFVNAWLRAGCPTKRMASVKDDDE